VDEAREAKLERLFEAAAALPPEDRPAFLEEKCGADPALRAELESLLADAQEADGFLDRVAGPVVARAAEAFTDPTESTGELDTDPLLGVGVGPFQVLERLGGGSMGVVYKARDTRLNRLVALKFLPLYLSADAQARARLMSEARATSALDHPNLAVVHEIGEHRGQLFIAMAFYEGETLKKKLARGPLPVREALDYVVQIAEGLQQAHEAGIVHRDIKPANVLVTERGQIKLVDFGIAKVPGESLTQTGVTVGTVAYMSPEQASGQAVDHRTDLWSLGVLLQEMVVGERRFRGGNAQAVLHAIRHDEPKPLAPLSPEMPEALVAVLERLLRKDPADRYQAASELLTDLQGLRESAISRPRSADRPPRVRLFERAPEKDVRETTDATSAEIERIIREPRIRRWPARILAPAGAALLIWGAWLVAGRVADSEPHLDSVAVLPLENLTGSPEQDYVADGMTEALIGSLGRISGLRRVISRTSAMRFKDSSLSLSEIGRALDVTAIVEGSVRAYGEQVQIDVRLIDAQTEERLLEQSFTRATGDVLALQNEVALAIAQTVEVRLTGTEEARLTQAAEVTPEVFDLYLRGLQSRVDGIMTRQQTIADFERAIAIDSSFAPAYAALAVEYVLSGSQLKAEQLAEGALALDPSLSEPYVALGLVREFIEWDWDGAERAFRRAIELNPGDAFAHHELGQLWTRQGRFEEALAQEKQALLLDPLSSRYQSGVGEVYLYSGRYDEAIVELEKAHAVNPNAGNYYGGHAHWEKGNYEEALESWEAYRGPEPVFEVGLARHDAVTGQGDKALEVIEEWKDRWEQGAVDTFIPWYIATVYTDLGEPEQALDWLERASESRLGFFVYVKVDPVFYPLHEEPRFQALLEKMGLNANPL
jgi:serine/threonine protein kinase/TolB-like protein/Tfp pilus assembly protein PilF